MSFRSSVAVGFKRVVRTPRLVLFAWAVNILLGLMVALPMFAMLDAYIGDTLYEQTLMERMDQNWWLTFKEDHPDNPVVDLLEYSVMGASTFIDQLDKVLQGGIVVPAADFLFDLLFRWTFSWSRMGILTFLGMISVAIQALLGGGFISAYRGDYPPTIGEFLSDGSTYFGTFIRLAGLVFLLQAVLLYPMVRQLSSWIASGTADQPSEMTPFLFYMVRNVLAFFLFFVVSLSADYARVRLVLERRTSALAAFTGGVRFVLGNPRVTLGIGLLLALCTLVAMSLYGLLEYLLPKNAGWLVVFLFVLHQAYMILRQFIRAWGYASEVDVFQSSGIRS